MKVIKSPYHCGTNSDSYVLKVYLPALQGHLPPDAIRAFCALLEFYYIARRDILTEDDLDELDCAITQFHEYREVFSPIHGKNGFSLPRQHSIVHLMASAHQLLNPNMSVPSKSPGVNQVAINPSSRCSQRISSLTRLWQRKLTLLPKTRLMEH